MRLAFPGDVVRAQDLDRAGFGLDRTRIVHQQPNPVGGQARTDFVGGLVIVVAKDGEAAPGKSLQGNQGLGQGAAQLLPARNAHVAAPEGLVGIQRRLDSASEGRENRRPRLERLIPRELAAPAGCGAY